MCHRSGAGIYLLGPLRRPHSTVQIILHYNFPRPQERDCLDIEKRLFCQLFRSQKGSLETKKSTKYSINCQCHHFVFLLVTATFFQTALGYHKRLTYLDVVTVSSVTIFSIRQSFVIRHFRSWVHSLVGSIAHCPSAV